MSYTDFFIDLALLKIEPPFEESDTVKPIHINNDYGDLEGRDVLISGWGSTLTLTPDNSFQLQAICLKITGKANSWMFGEPNIKMFSSEGRGACFGDSGGK